MPIHGKKDTPKYAIKRDLSKSKYSIMWVLIAVISLMAIGISSAAFFLLSPKNAAPLPPAHSIIDKADPSPTPPIVLEANTLYIPSLDIKAPVGSISLNNNSLQVPGNVHNVGLYDHGGQLDGTTGTVLLTGHVNYYNQGEGALWNLSSVHINAPLYVSDSVGKTTSWRVTQVITVQKNYIPQAIFSSTGPRQLVVVTCGGALLRDGHYADNVLVVASPIAASRHNQATQ